MKQNKIFAIVKKPGASPEIKLVDGEPRALSVMVDGKREIIPFPGLPGVCVVFDGKGGANKKPNCFLPEYNDLITGTALFAGINFETGFISLSEMQAVIIEDYLKANDAKNYDGNIERKIAAGYLPQSEENYLFGMLCEVKTKYKAVKIKWLGKR